ncbi:hypothetical protein F7725_006831, partial [Dissostichus mawsoni]
MTMTLVEFTSLWKKINEYKQHFHRADVNKNGSLTDTELNVAIKAAEPEIDLNSGMVRLMTFRYSSFEATTMEGFISLMLRLGKTT